MSKYTVQLKNVLESKSGLNFLNPLQRPTYEQVIEKSRQRVFNFYYPIFAERYREVLETKILKHFYFRELAFETYGAWLLHLDAKMNEIMPYYNQLYSSEDLIDDPFADTDYTIEHDGDGTRNGTYTGQTISENHNTHSADTTEATDNTTTHTINETLSNTHNETTDTNGNHTTTYNTHDLTTNTGTTRFDRSGNEIQGGTDSTETGTNTTTTTENEHWDLYSDTPQGQINNINEPGYYTNIRKVTDDGGGTEKVTANSETTYGKTVGTTGTDTQTDNTQTNLNKTGTEALEDNVGVEVDGNYTDTRTGTNKDILDGDKTINVTGKADDNGTVTKNNSEQIKTTDDFLRHISGKRGGKSYAELLRIHRDNMLNIDKMILDELEELFFLIWL